MNSGQILLTGSCIFCCIKLEAFQHLFSCLVGIFEVEDNVNVILPNRGVELKLARGGIIWACARANSPPQAIFSLLGMIFAPLWAFFFKLSLYNVRMAKFSGGSFPP